MPAHDAISGRLLRRGETRFFQKTGFLNGRGSEGEGGFPCLYWLSALIGVVTALPSTALMLVGVRDAGEETLLRYS